MGTGQLLIIRVLFILDNKELHRFEAIDRRPITASGEGEQGTPFVIVPLLEHDLPEPLDQLALLPEPASVVATVLQLFEVKRSLATDQLLQVLSRQYRLQHLDVHHTLKAFLERSDLLSALLLELILDKESNELVSVVQSDWNFHATFNELYFLRNTELLDINGETSAHNIL